MTNDKDKRNPWSKFVVPVVVPVVVAILIAVFTPVGTRMQSELFPSSSTVRGAVKLNGQTVEGADVTLDGTERFTTDAGGAFVLGKVREGDHTLEITVRGARAHSSSFLVKRNDEETNLGAIDLVPSLRIAGEGSGGLQPPDAREATFTVDIDITMWLDGDADVLSQVKTVTYAMPTRIQPSPVAVSSPANRFCHRLSRSLKMRIGESVDGPTTATVTFDDGKTLALTVPSGEKLPSGQRPPNCP